MTTTAVDTPLQRHLLGLHACEEAREWAGSRTAKQTWEECERPDWLLWWAARTSANSRSDIVRSACDCARSVLHLVPDGEDRPRLAIEAAEICAAGPSDASANAARAAADAAYAAYAAYAADAAADAAYAADAADAAYAAARAAAYAAAYAAARAAACAAADAADAAADAAACAAARVNLCNIIRQRLSQPWSE